MGFKKSGMEKDRQTDTKRIVIEDVILRELGNREPQDEGGGRVKGRIHLALMRFLGEA